MSHNDRELVSNPEVTVCIACRNEEQNVEAIAAAVISEMESVAARFDIIFIDNESNDRTVEIVTQMCDRDPRIKLIVNTRNFGQMRSPTHAIYAAQGSGVISMCADFQDSPALLPEFVRRWRAGTPIVLGVRKVEKNSLLLKFFRNLSYSLQRRFGDYPVVPNAGCWWRRGTGSKRFPSTVRRVQAGALKIISSHCWTSRSTGSLDHRRACCVRHSM
jgi:glycosyltransferase involved in cell wall biosynthesis